MSKTTNTPELVNTDEYAALHGVTSNRVRQWIRAGRLPVARENPYLIDAAIPRPQDQKRGRKVAPVKAKAGISGKSRKKRK